MEPSSGKAESAKHAALSVTQSSVPNVMTRPEATRSPELEWDPVRNETPVAALGPTVGANCRGEEHDSAIGMAIEVAWGHKVQAMASVGGIGHKHKHAAMCPGLGPSC